MAEFKQFKQAVQKQLKMMESYPLFKTEISKDMLWETYLESFPEGTNGIFRERREYDCQCCKQFIRTIGNIVAIIANEVVSIWDIEVDGYYQVVSDELSKAVKAKKIVAPFLHYENTVGTDYNNQMLDNEDLITWHHFYVELPQKVICSKDDISTKISDVVATQAVFARGLKEISVDALETVLDLISQNSLYRGEENKAAVSAFLNHKEIFLDLPNKKARENYCWSNTSQPHVLRIRNSAIGTLLLDLSKDVELDKTVKAFEVIVAPTNYKRPTALISKKMIENAHEKTSELGIESAMHRRYAVAEDLTINNVLFADRSVKKAMNAFDELIESTSDAPKNLSKIKEVSIEKFIASILPKSTSIEVLVENQHITNLVSLVAPQIENSKNLFKWDNGFSWAYNGDLTDSIKEKVKKAGGNVNAVLRCSLSWYNYDDLDIHVIEPLGNKIYYGNKTNPHSSCHLDVDMNVNANESRSPVENVVWTNENTMQHGTYKVVIHNFNARESIDVGFEVEVEYKGAVHNFHYAKKVKQGENILVAEFDFTKEEGIKFIKSLPESKASREIWNISTNKFQKVSMIMNSPNHWDGEETGNKHYFFMLQNCINDNKARGFFNEFLRGDLTEHRKVFEVLGSKMMTEKSNNQLSGVGFSSTQNNSVVCRVKGSFSRSIKINF